MTTKRSALCRASMLVAIAAALATPTRASAHTQSGSLASGASATDLYQVTCFNNGSGAPSSLVLSVIDTSPGALPLVSVHGRRAASALTASDTTTADAVPSPTIYVNEGAGGYDVLVTKSGSGSKFYSLTYHCTTLPDGAGVHTGSALSTLQDQ